MSIINYTAKASETIEQGGRTVLIKKDILLRLAAKEGLSLRKDHYDSGMGTLSRVVREKEVDGTLEREGWKTLTLRVLSATEAEYEETIEWGEWINTAAPEDNDWNPFDDGGLFGN